MALPASGYLSNTERTVGEMRQALEDQRDVVAGNTTDIGNRVISATLDVAMSATDVTLTEAQSKHQVINLTGTLTANVALIVPDTARTYTIVNSTSGAFTVTVKTAAGTGEPVPQGQARVFRSDGVDVVFGAEVDDSQIKPALNASGAAPIYACRAWVNFDGTGVVTVRAAGNVVGITDNGTGDYSLNFAIDMPDENYSVTSAGSVDAATNSPRQGPGVFNLTVSSFSVGTGSDTTTRNDWELVCLSVFR